MGIDRDTWKQIYNRFDPKARLELDDRALFVSRPGSVSDDIITDLREGLEPEGKWIVCGSTGSGKSTELVHLADQLQGQRVVLGLDLPRSVARVDQLQPAEVLFLIGAAAVKLQQVWGQSPDPKLVTQLQEAFKGLLRDTSYSVPVASLLEGVVLFGANVAAPGAGAVAGAATGAVKALSAMKERINIRRPGPIAGLTRPLREGEPDLESLREATDGLLDCIRNDLPPVVLVDGLDKVQDRAVVRDLFATTRILAMPRAQVVYTGPISLMLSTDWQATKGAFERARLTNVAITSPALKWARPSADKIEAGREALRQVVGRRLDRIQLAAAEVFTDGNLERIIDASGGLLRDLIQLVNRASRLALRYDQDRIDDHAAAGAIEEIRKEYGITLNTRRMKELSHVRKCGRPSGDEEVSLDLLMNGYVLPYTNGEIWFEPHPILGGLPAAD